MGTLNHSHMVWSSRRYMTLDPYSMPSLFRHLIPSRSYHSHLICPLPQVLHTVLPMPSRQSWLLLLNLITTPLTRLISTRHTLLILPPLLAPVAEEVAVVAMMLPQLLLKLKRKSRKLHLLLICSVVMMVEIIK